MSTVGYGDIAPRTVLGSSSTVARQLEVDVLEVVGASTLYVDGFHDDQANDPNPEVYGTALVEVTPVTTWKGTGTEAARWLPRLD